MIQCYQCGQANSANSNFCRFCGAHFTQTENQTDYDAAPPRPYVWKTDEFQISKAKQRKTEEFRFNELNPNTAPVPNHPFQTQQLAQMQPNWMSRNYHCPRCGSSLTPRIERKISNAGWIVFAVLLITFFPLFWIGFFIKEDVRVCPVCNLRVG